MSEGSESDNIRVLVRVRPRNDREEKAREILSVGEDGRLVVEANPPREFTYDTVLGSDSSQADVFRTVGRPITEGCLRGYNGCIFAYGQTGSGKTHTILGPHAASGSAPESERGLLPRVLEHLFAEMEQQVKKLGSEAFGYTCQVSFLEIYNERVFDLLDAGATSGAGTSSLNLREDLTRGVFVEGLTEISVDSAQDALDAMRRGARNRTIAATSMNRTSSRAHSVFTLDLEARERPADGSSVVRARRARFHLIDLAGSERQRRTSAAGSRLKEAGAINRSLSALGNVISALAANAKGSDEGSSRRHVHYRDSKLTFLLKDSLGGNSRTALVATVSPADDSMGETLSTLKFAARAKLVENRASVNEETSGSIAALQAEVRRLKEALANGGGGGGGILRGVSTAGSAGDVEVEVELDEGTVSSLEGWEIMVRKYFGADGGGAVGEGNVVGMVAKILASAASKLPSDATFPLSGLLGALSTIDRRLHRATKAVAEASHLAATQSSRAEAALRLRLRMLHTIRLLRLRLALRDQASSSSTKSVSEHKYDATAFHALLRDTAAAAPASNLPILRLQDQKEEEEEGEERDDDFLGEDASKSSSLRPTAETPMSQSAAPPPQTPLPSSSSSSISSRTFWTGPPALTDYSTWSREDLEKEAVLLAHLLYVSPEAVEHQLEAVELGAELNRLRRKLPENENEEEDDVVEEENVLVEELAAASTEAAQLRVLMREFFGEETNKTMGVAAVAIANDNDDSDGVVEGKESDGPAKKDEIVWAVRAWKREEGLLDRVGQLEQAEKEWLAERETLEREMEEARRSGEEERALREAAEMKAQRAQRELKTVRAAHSDVGGELKAELEARAETERMLEEAETRAKRTERELAEAMEQVEAAVEAAEKERAEKEVEEKMRKEAEQKMERAVAEKEEARQQLERAKAAARDAEAAAKEMDAQRAEAEAEAALRAREAVAERRRADKAAFEKESLEEDVEDLGTEVAYLTQRRAEAVQEAEKTARELETLRAQLNEAREDRERLQKELGQTKTEREEVWVERDGLKVERDGLRAEVERMRTEMERSEASEQSEKSQTTEKMQEMQRAVTEAQRRADEMRAQAAEQTARLRTSMTELEQTTDQLRQAVAEERVRREAAETRLEETESRLAEASKRADATKSELDEERSLRAAALQDVHQALEEERRHVHELEEQAESAKDRMVEAETRISELETELEAARDSEQDTRRLHSTALADIARLESELADLQTSLQTLQNEHETTLKERDSTLESLASTQSDLEALRASAATTRSQLQDALDRSEAAREEAATDARQAATAKREALDRVAELEAQVEQGELALETARADTQSAVRRLESLERALFETDGVDGEDFEEVGDDGKDGEDGDDGTDGTDGNTPQNTTTNPGLEKRAASKLRSLQRVAQEAAKERQSMLETIEELNDKLVRIESETDERLHSLNTELETARTELEAKTQEAEKLARARDELEQMVERQERLLADAARETDELRAADAKWAALVTRLEGMVASKGSEEGTLEGDATKSQSPSKSSSSSSRAEMAMVKERAERAEGAARRAERRRAAAERGAQMVGDALVSLASAAEALESRIDALAGHSNPKQRIQMHMQLKTEARNARKALQTATEQCSTLRSAMLHLLPSLDDHPEQRQALQNALDAAASLEEKDAASSSSSSSSSSSDNAEKDVLALRAALVTATARLAELNSSTASTPISSPEHPTSSTFAFSESVQSAAKQAADILARLQGPEAAKPFLEISRSAPKTISPTPQSETHDVLSSFHRQLQHLVLTHRQNKPQAPPSSPAPVLSPLSPQARIRRRNERTSLVSPLATKPSTPLTARLQGRSSDKWVAERSNTGTGFLC